ncbi:MAG: hypothetical protein EHM12_01755 [Dehalococcoidia bacterium]|nr:MAG: hypothetical protein EHM12_01755 [Dehalococcoidia bacterium]
MKKSLLVVYILMAISVLFVLVSGCAGTSSIEHATICSKVTQNGEPETIANTFTPDVSSIYCSVKLRTISLKSNVKAEWYIVNSDEASLKNTLIGQGSVIAGTPYVVLQFARADKLLPKGDYEVKLYFDDVLAQALPFKVQGEATASTAVLSEVTMCTSLNLLTNKPLDKTDIFPNDISIIFCSMKLDEADFNTVIKARWTYISGELDSFKGKTIYEPTTKAEGLEYISFSIGMSPGKQLPIGQYNITLFVDGKEQANVPFTVVDPASIKWPYVSEMSTFSYADKEKMAINLTARFPVDSKEINYKARAYNAPVGTELVIEWILDRSADGIIQEKLVKEDKSVIDGTVEVRGALVTKSDPFVKGDYLIKILIGGQEIMSFPFKIE